LIKKKITLVAALSGFAVAILIPVVASSADTVTACPPGQSAQYCSVSNLRTWTESQSKTTVKAGLTLPSSTVSTVELSGITLSTTSSKTIGKDLTIKSGSKTISYSVSSASGSKLTIKPKSAEKSLALTIDTKLFKTKAKSATLSLIVKSAGGTTYTEKFTVKF
jgi:uncharacterized lipoprotein YbaY